eukprot:gene9516-18583_t
MMLCLTGRTFEACKCLQEWGLWTEAAELAKASLDKEGRHDTLHRWAVYLLSSSEP